MGFVWIFAFLVGVFFIYKFWKKRKKLSQAIALCVLLLAFIPFLLHPVVNILIVRPIYVHFDKKHDKACDEAYQRWIKGNPIP